MKLFQKGILPVLFIVFSVSESFRVLGVFPTTWKSHWTIGTSILKQLSSAGHDVTLVSPFELKTENMRNVILRGQPTSEHNLIIYVLKSIIFSLIRIS